MRRFSKATVCLLNSSSLITRARELERLISLNVGETSYTGNASADVTSFEGHLQLTDIFRLNV